MSLTDNEKEIFIYKLLGSEEGFQNPFSDSFSSLKSSLESFKEYINGLTAPYPTGFTLSEIEEIVVEIDSYISDIDSMVDHTNRLSGVSFSQGSQSSKPDIQTLMTAIESRKKIYEKVEREDLVEEKTKELVGSLFNINEEELKSDKNYFDSVQDRIESDLIEITAQDILNRFSNRQDLNSLITNDINAFTITIQEIRNSSYAKTLGGFYFSDSNIFLEKVLKKPVKDVLDGKEPDAEFDDILSGTGSPGDISSGGEEPPPPPNYIESESENITGANEVENLVTITQADYDSLPEKDPKTLYVIVG